ncbi:MAG: ABC transporter ATP-binding protein [Deltaproteobacteria bacterium]|nr:ABC transporter ATP-binding protein [Deltaproteobacteria bacterium]
MILSCESLDYSYGRNKALAGVSFSLEQGCAGLLGPNGAGKSTLMKCLIGHRRIEKGRINVLGYDPAVHGLEIRNQVGVMPESDVYLPNTTGLEMTLQCARLCGLPRAHAMSRSHEVLGYVGLGEERYRQVEQYSTGMRARLKLACAIVHGPKLLLLDEPTSGLDPAGREQMLELVDDITHRTGVSALFSSHILHDIEKVSDQVVVLTRGQVVFSGNKVDFLLRNTGRLNVKVKSGRERLAEKLAALGCKVEMQEGRDVFQVGMPEGGTVKLIWQAAHELGVQVRHLAPFSIGLDDAFKQAMQESRTARTTREDGI